MHFRNSVQANTCVRSVYALSALVQTQAIQGDHWRNRHAHSRTYDRPAYSSCSDCLWRIWQHWREGSILYTWTL